MNLSPRIKHILEPILLLIGGMMLACSDENSSLAELPEEPPSSTPVHINPDSIFAQYTLLPEARIVASQDSQWFAAYINPTDRYAHGILGDKIEAGGLVMYHEGEYFPVILPENMVFEDVAPRMIDVDDDRIPELLCIRSEVNSGAGLVIYQWREERLYTYAFVKEIGTANRWLNVVAVKDLDRDHQLNLFWIQTPHIGGIIKGQILSLEK